MLRRSVARQAPRASRTIVGFVRSCDESCAAVVRSDRTVLSSVVVRQNHQDTQGIHPLQAARGHHRHVPRAIAQALDEAQLTIHDLDGIGVTRGPGMPGCLAVGMTAAKTLAAVHRALIPI